MSVHFFNGISTTGPASSEATAIDPACPHAKYIQQILRLQASESDLGPQYRAELASLAKERDPELFWSSAIRAVERWESEATESRLPYILTAWLQNPELETTWRQLLERKLEEAQGRGSFGARAEFFISRLNREAFDPKAMAPMLAAGLLGKAVQSAVLGGLSATAPAWWSRGLVARSAAFTAGFGSEVGLLGTAHGEFGRSALSLATMKLGLWGGQKAALPIPLSLVVATALGMKAEERLGWRAPSSLAENFAEAGASAFHFGLGMSLAARILGPRFVELQRRLALASSRPTPFPESGLALGPRLAAVPGFSSASDGFLGAPKPLQMSEQQPSGRPASGAGDFRGFPAEVVERRIPNSSGPARPFELLLGPENRRIFLDGGEDLVGQRFLIARRDGIPLWAKLERKAFIAEGDPIVPSGVTRLNFRLEEGDSRGLAYAYQDRKGLTLFFIDLEEKMITQGAPMRPGSGTVFMTWLAEQAKQQGKGFNVTRITNPHMPEILRKMELVGPNCRVEACARINPESYDEEYRVLARFPFDDRSAWGHHRHDADFFNVFGAE